MQVESTPPTIAGAGQRRVESERSLQNVFAQVLARAGQQGYASAEVPAKSAVTGEKITESWHSWLAAGGHVRYDDMPSRQQLLDDFNGVMLQAYEANAYAAPQAFLAELNPAQLKTVQDVHRLAAPINVAELTMEGSLNLLLPPPAQVDLDRDGLTQSGAALGFRFPDSRTPRAVADAWYDTTATLSFEDRSIRQLQMKLDVLLANIHVDANGRFSHRSQPGDADWVNLLEAPDYSYLDKAQATLDSIEYFKHQTPPEQYHRDRQFWGAFLESLRAHGAS